MDKDILKYFEKGITITPIGDGKYRIFTIETQHFEINSLDELSVEKFENAISDLLEQNKIRIEINWELNKQFGDHINQGILDKIRKSDEN
jgi:hypothetical protein